MARRADRLKRTADESDFLDGRGWGREFICHTRRHLRWIKTNWNRRCRREGRRLVEQHIGEFEDE